MRSAISIDRLTKAYGRKLVINGITLEIDHGITGLLGPNGAGKTTLMRMLATVARPNGGELRLLGRDPRDAAERTARPAEAGLPAAGTRLPSPLRGVRVRRLHRDAQGVDRARGAPRRSAPGAACGRAR